MDEENDLSDGRVGTWGRDIRQLHPHFRVRALQRDDVRLPASGGLHEPPDVDVGALRHPSGGDRRGRLRWSGVGRGETRGREKRILAPDGGDLVLEDGHMDRFFFDIDG